MKVAQYNFTKGVLLRQGTGTRGQRLRMSEKQSEGIVTKLLRLSKDGRK